MGCKCHLFVCVLLWVSTGMTICKLHDCWFQWLAVQYVLILYLSLQAALGCLLLVCGRVGVYVLSGSSSGLLSCGLLGYVLGIYVAMPVALLVGV